MIDTGQELTIQKQPNTSLKDNGPPSNSGGQTPQSNSNQKSPAGYVLEPGLQYLLLKCYIDLPFTNR